MLQFSFSGDINEELQTKWHNEEIANAILDNSLLLEQLNNESLSKLSIAYEFFALFVFDRPQFRDRLEATTLQALAKAHPAFMQKLFENFDICGKLEPAFFDTMIRDESAVEKLIKNPRLLSLANAETFLYLLTTHERVFQNVVNMPVSHHVYSTYKLTNIALEDISFARLVLTREQFQSAFSSEQWIDFEFQLCAKYGKAALMDDELLKQKRKTGTVMKEVSHPRSLALYHLPSQALWHVKFKEMVSAFAAKMPSFNSFLEAFEYLAKERSNIARQLNHKNAEKFGLFRRECQDSYERIDVYDPQIWGLATSKIYDAIYALIPKEGAAGSPYFTYYRQKGLTRVRHKFQFKSHYPTQQLLPNVSCSRNLIHIELDEDEGVKQAMIHYTAMNKYDSVGDHVIADRYYQKLVNWSDKEDIQSFLYTAAFLSHHVLQCFFVKRGNASIIEGMICGIAEDRGIVLGPVNRENELTWDFKLLTTPDPADFARWYVKNMFKPSCEAKSARPLLFQFDLQKPSSHEAKILPELDKKVKARVNFD